MFSSKENQKKIYICACPLTLLRHVYVYKLNEEDLMKLSKFLTNFVLTKHCHACYFTGFCKNFLIYLISVAKNIF